MSEASCTYTSPYDLLVRHTPVRLSLNGVRFSIMIKNILSPEYYEFIYYLGREAGKEGREVGDEGAGSGDRWVGKRGSSIPCPPPHQCVEQK